MDYLGCQVYRVKLLFQVKEDFQVPKEKLVHQEELARKENEVSLVLQGHPA